VPSGIVWVVEPLNLPSQGDLDGGGLFYQGAILEEEECAWGDFCPCFVGGEGFGGDEGYSVFRCGYGAEIDGDIGVFELGFGEGGLADDVVEIVVAMGEKKVLVAEEKVEDAVFGDFFCAAVYGVE